MCAIVSGWRSCSNVACCRGSFIPPAAVRDLRDLTRLRKALIRERAHHVNRIAKTLELANIKLGSVVTDIMGKTGRAILQALSTGLDDPAQLAARAQGSLRKKQAALREAVEGRLTPHYAFLLEQHLALIDTLDAHIATLDTRIEAAMAPFAEAAALVQTMPGVAERADAGDPRRDGRGHGPVPHRPSTSRPGRACVPARTRARGNGGPPPLARAPPGCGPPCKRRPGRRCERRRATTAPSTTGMKARGGPKKAIVAVQHAMIVALWHMLKHRVPHQDLGADYFDRRNTARIRRHHVRRLEQLGYQVLLAEPAA